MLRERKRKLKSNTKAIQVKHLDFVVVKKFHELMERTGAESNLKAMMIIIDLLDGELPKIDFQKEGKIPTSVIEWRRANGFDDEIVELNVSDSLRY